jgi:hypothetical protein
MIVAPILAFVATLATSVLGQDLNDFTGTWSSGSQAVMTGPVCNCFLFIASCSDVTSWARVLLILPTFPSLIPKLLEFRTLCMYFQYLF